MPDSEKVCSDKGEHHKKISGDPSRSGPGLEDDPVPPGDGGAGGCLCAGWTDGKELFSDPGHRAGHGQTHCGNGPDRHRAWYNGYYTQIEWTKYDLKLNMYLLICRWELKILHYAFKGPLILLLCFSLVFLFILWAARHGDSRQVWNQIKKCYDNKGGVAAADVSHCELPPPEWWIC